MVRYGLIALWTVVVVAIVAGVFIALGHPDDGEPSSAGPGSSAAQSVGMSVNVRHVQSDLDAYRADLRTKLADFLGVDEADIIIGEVKPDAELGGHKVALTLPRGTVNTLVHGADRADSRLVRRTACPALFRLVRVFMFIIDLLFSPQDKMHIKFVTDSTGEQHYLDPSERPTTTTTTTTPTTVFETPDVELEDCRAATQDFRCSGLEGCKWCAARKVCLHMFESAAGCDTCVNYHSDPAGCMAETGCEYCTSYRQCMSVKFSASCPQCSRTTESQMCHSLPGCRFCPTLAVCHDRARNASLQTYCPESCHAFDFGRPSCQLAKGCFYCGSDNRCYARNTTTACLTTPVLMSPDVGDR